MFSSACASFFSPPCTFPSRRCPVNDTLDDIFDESGDEEESQDIVNQVLDEIGIEISGKVRNSKRKTFVMPIGHMNDWLYDESDSARNNLLL